MLQGEDLVVFRSLFAVLLFNSCGGNVPYAYSKADEFIAEMRRDKTKMEIEEDGR